MALLFALFVAHAASFPTTTTLKTESGPSVSAWYGVPSRAQRGVVMVAGESRGKDDWMPLAETLFKSGIAVIAVDLRKTTAAGAPLAAEDYRKMTEEVRAASAFLHTKGVTHLSLVGAEIGANLCINVAADDPSVVSVALLSPGMDLHGVIANDAVTRYGARPLLLVSSADDAYGSRTVRALEALAKGEDQSQSYDHAGKGTQMFNQEPGLGSVIAGFIARGWTSAAAPPPASLEAPKALTATPIETSGPSTPDVPAP